MDWIGKSISALDLLLEAYYACIPDLHVDIGHGGSDGLHGYVPSLDNVVADTVSICFKLQSIY